MDNLGIRDVTESILTNILLPLHFPADEPNFKPLHHYNQLRQLLEYIFRACNKVGLIPDQCMDGQNVNLSQSSLYLAGKNANIAGVRYGNDGDRVIPIYIENFIRSILDFGNSQSHTVELTTADKQNVESIFRAKKSQYIIFSLAMQICEVIIWIDRYISAHNDKAVNLSKCKALPKDGAKYNGRECVPVKDEKGFWHCEECLVIVKPENVGKTLRLRDIRPNTSTSKEIYPYFAYFDIVQ